MALLEGKKTYLVAFLGIILAGLKAQGYIDAQLYDVLLGLLGFLGLAALRASK